MGVSVKTASFCITSVPPLGNNTNVENNSTFVFLIYTDFFAILRNIEEN